MGGEIKVVKKDGPGTLMRLYLLLKAPVDGIEQNCQVDFAKHNLVVSKIIFFRILFENSCAVPLWNNQTARAYIVEM